MLSVLIYSRRSYPAMPLIGQLVHHWSVHSGPCVLRADLRKFPTPTTDRDQTVSRRSKPNSRTAINGRTAQPLEASSPPGCDESTSRCQTLPSMWSLGKY